ncbi:MAG: ATP-binding protein, partial [Saccharopolyspora sp.]|uniref:ATP-binding protein n=1 Tax=Saccharopolyspora sp. TaxID=33915 RepID=UPI0025E117D4
MAERTSAEQDPVGARLAGRDDVLAEVLRTVQAKDVPVTLLSGAAGSGRTAVLAEVRDRCTAAGARVLEMRATEPDRSTPYGALYRLLSEVGELAPAAGEARGSVLALVAKLSAAPDPATSQPIAAQLAGALHAATRNMRPLVVLADDAQWLDDATAALLEPLVQRMNGNSFSIVLSARSDVDSGRGVAALRRLRAAGLVRTVTLRPLARLHSARLIARRLQAKPDAEVVDMLHGAARGLPAALEAGIAAYRRAEALSIVDRHAYLVSHEERP